jgi:hypothetical protein
MIRVPLDMSMFTVFGRIRGDVACKAFKTLSMPTNLKPAVTGTTDDNRLIPDEDSHAGKELVIRLRATIGSSRKDNTGTRPSAEFLQAAAQREQVSSRSCKLRTAVVGPPYSHQCAVASRLSTALLVHAVGPPNTTLSCKRRLHDVVARSASTSWLGLDPLS